MSAKLLYFNKLQQTKKEKRLGIHSFHRYFGKLIPAIPRFAIEEFTKEGDIVYDPFCGSGTTLVEASHLNRKCYGLDLNPLAILASKVKITPINPQTLIAAYNKLIKEIKNDKSQIKQEEIPFCININHWYRDYVIRDLVLSKKHIDRINDNDVKDFFLLCFSAVNRNVSNADPMHVFPGYSKRLRRLDAAGKREIDVFSSFEKTVKRRIKFMSELFNNNAKKAYGRVCVGNAMNPSIKLKNVKLIVTNPPYISSIRYLETTKLEMYWLNYLADRDSYFELDKKIIGTEKFPITSYSKLSLTRYNSINKKIITLFTNGTKKMSKVVADYFNNMDKVFNTFDNIVAKNGHVVIKISASHVRTVRIPTHKFFIEMLAKKHKFRLVDSFKDVFENRSLSTARNYYSGRIDYDWILIFKKKV